MAAIKEPEVVGSDGAPDALTADRETLSSTGNANGSARLGDATSAWRVPVVPVEQSSKQSHGRLGGLALACSDAASFVVAVIASPTGAAKPRLDVRPLALLALAAGAWVLSFEVMGLHSSRRFSAGEEIRRILGAAGIGLPLVLLAGLWPAGLLSPTSVGVTWVFAVGLEVTSRTGRLWLRHLSKGSLNARVQTIIVGPREEAMRLADRLRSPSTRFDSTRFDPLGYVEPAGADARRDGLAETNSEAGDLRDLMRARSVDCVFISPGVTLKEVLPIIRAGREGEAEVRLFTSLPAILSSRVSVEPVGGYATLCIKPATLSGPKAAVKRAFDVVAATLVLIAVFPLLVAVAAAVRLTSPGPAIYRQARVTKGGRVFTMYKFRTMATGDDPDPAAPPINPAVPYFKLREDPRVSRIGRILRSLSIDELPQLVNVIRGDMSLVGPRPLWIAQVADNLDVLAARHEVRAGITGWWQVNGRSDVPPEEAFRLDAAYVENWSLSLDLYILTRTVGAVISRRGAY
jgi:exopolysaccharide biosynthesis polyprenyl glycosylphosphotransferase